MPAVGLLAVFAYVVGDVAKAGGIPFALVAMGLWAVSMAIAVGGVISTVAAIIRRQMPLPMAMANLTLFACAATLVVIGLSRFARLAWSS